FHLPNTTRHDGFEVVAVVDLLEERRAEAAEKFGVPKGYATVEDLFAHEQLDLIVIASPTPYHRPHAVAAFERGIDVFCDKPMAPNLADADAMIDAAKRHGRKLMAYQPSRARRSFIALQDLLARNLIGEVYMMKRTRVGWQRRNDWQAFKANGGGMLNNYGAHQIDELLYFADSPVKRVDCSLRSVATLGDADDVVKAVIQTEKGMILDTDINMAMAGELPSWQVMGQYGTLTLSDNEREWRARYFDPKELTDVGLQEGFVAEARRYGSGDTIPWRDETFQTSDYADIDYYDKCYEYFALDKQPFVSVEETRELIRVLQACRDDAASRE
ncbi:MAG: Gfo/Idh/MocA family oxidoreductase, partial [Candidatus Poribacteria bacterium]|nr:Gfo/Idh/MocA family oxidoreductase [Candidatus Poribacteria bacterium]